MDHVLFEIFKIIFTVAGVFVVMMLAYALWVSHSIKGITNQNDEDNDYDESVSKRIVFNGKNGKIISNNTNIKKVNKIGTGHYEFEE